MRMSDWSSDVFSSDLAARDRRRDVGGIDLEPARIDPAAIAQRRHQRAVAAADIEHARTRHDMIGDDREIGAQAHAPARRKPSTMRRNSGDSSRKASWPNGLDNSTKPAGPPAAV